jgi:hypothetical protein
LQNADGLARKADFTHLPELREFPQVAPIKLVLKALKTKRLKLKVDEQLSSFAFTFKLRR